MKKGDACLFLPHPSCLVTPDTFLTRLAIFLPHFLLPLLDMAHIRPGLAAPGVGFRSRSWVRSRCGIPLALLVNCSQLGAPSEGPPGRQEPEPVARVVNGLKVTGTDIGRT